MKRLILQCSILYFWIGFFSTSSFAQSGMCSLNAPILDNSCTASSNFPISISGTTGTQLGTDVILQEVQFIVAHTWDDDLDIYLISPSGVSVELSTDNGGGANNYGDPSDNTCSNFTSLSMNACLSIEAGIAPFLGNYVPEGDFKDFNDNSDPDGTWILKICDDASTDVGYLHFVELVFAEMSCSPATQLFADSLSDESLTLNWQAGSSCVNTLLEYGPVGFVPGAGATAGQGTLINLPCPVNQPYQINGLEDLTIYDIYIREQCSNGGYAANSCPLTITTNCSTPETTLLENFDLQASCSTTCGATCPITGTWFNIDTDDFDWLVDDGGTGSANTGPSDDVSGGGQYIYTEASGSACRNGNQAVLQSECILVDASNGTCHLSFYYHLYGTHINELRLQASTNGGSNWTTLWSVIGAQGDQWWRQYVDLSTYHNKLVTFRFVAIGGNGIQGDMALDEISFFGGIPAPGGGTIFYADQDGDTFGDPNNTITLCTESTPVGYVTNGDDCDDSTNAISPIATEIPCNDVDENCDGVFLDLLPTPDAENQVVCIGANATLTVNGMPTGNYYWSDGDENILFVGDTFYTPVLQQSTNYWVQDSVVNTCSSPGEMIVVTVDAGPSIGTNDLPAICQGDTFNLSSINLVDMNNNVATITYHDAIPTDASNELASPFVQPPGNTNYYIRAETINGCPDELAVTVSVNNTPTAIITAANGELDICANELTAITGSEGGTGSGQITYLWEDGSTAPERSIFPSNPTGPETYFLQVTDNNDCKGLDSIIINTLPSITGVAITALSNVTFCNGNNGFITLEPVDGLAPFTYQWDGPVAGNDTSNNTNFTIAGLTQGSYKITITDSAGANCTVFIPNIIINGPGVEVDTVVNIAAVTCNGGMDGGIDLTVTGGTPDYVWSNGAETPDLEDVVAGSYSVTIIDGICETVIEDLVVTEPEAITAALASTQMISCSGGNNGAIDINISGGVAPYTFLWSNGANSEDLNLLPEGAYQLTITDANACSLISQTITITEPNALSLQVDSISEVSCYNGADAFIDITISGGTDPYFFQWSNDLLTEDIQNLSAGIYQPTITDANDCILLGSELLVEAPEQLNVLLDTIRPPSCNQILDGSIDVSISGGAAPYTYVWSNGLTTEDISDLPEGHYQLSITDVNGCTMTAESYELIAPEVLFFGLVFVNEESCMGVEDGSITIQVSGGTQPYGYLWDSGQTTDDIYNLSAGFYQVTITDAMGCTKVSPSLEVVALEPYASSIAQQENISCAGKSDGNIYITVPPEGMPYEYDWNSGAVNQNLTNISPGIYSAQITANDGCIFFTPDIIITEPDSLKLEIASIEAPTCNGFFNGSIDVSVTGGTTPYNYSWNIGTIEEDLTDAASGNYSLTVLDQNGCATEVNDINLMEPDAMEMTTVSTNVGCADSTGNISVALTGGTQPYTYTWNTGDTLSTLEDKSPGVYSLSVTDANDCFIVHSNLEIDQVVDSLVVIAIEESPLSCFGLSDANLSIQINGGNSPFQYNWSNGVTDSLNQNLSGGNYNVTVTDHNGCVGISNSISIVTPTEIEFFADNIGDNLCNGDNEGFISIIASGGLSPLAINWSNGADSTYIDQLESGDYFLTITDQNNCTTVSVQPIVVDGPGSSVFGEIIGPNSISCFGDMDVMLSINPLGGVGGYSFLWNTGAVTADLNNLGPGWYQCTITDANNCEYITPIKVVEGPDAPLQILMDSSQVLNNEDCDGMAGAIALVVSGGTEDYNYLWNNNTTTSNIAGLISGAYICTVTDANDCITISEPIIIEEPENTLEVTMNSTPEVNEMSDGRAAAVVDGGTWPFSFLWDQQTGSQTDSIAVNLAGGNYTVTVTDAHQCTFIAEVLVDTITILSEATYEFRELGSFQYFPNPVKDFLNVEVELVRSAEMTLRMYNVTGQLVWQVRKTGTTSEQLLIDMQQLPSGLYLLALEIDGKMVQGKRVVRSE